MGRTLSSGMQLSVSEQTKIKNKIEEKNPEQLKCSSHCLILQVVLSGRVKLSG